MVNFLDDLDGHEDGVFLEIDERIGVVEQDVGVENVVFHGLKKGTAGFPSRTRRWIEDSVNSFKRFPDVFPDAKDCQR
jgi:hypothetical protein